MENKVSIIVPVYNGDKYIDRFWGSIEQQVFRDFEVVFIDDGSTDHSRQLLEDHLSKSRLKTKLICQENRGVSSARNTGLNEIESKYVCFCDIDDTVTSSFLSVMVKMMDSSGADVAISGIKVDGNKDNRVIDSSQALQDYLYNKFSVSVCGSCIRCSLLKKNHIQFPEGYKYCEDLYFMWKVFAMSSKVVCIRQSMYNYIHNQGSAMSLFDVHRFDAFLLMKQLEAYMMTERPEFYPIYARYGAARVMWSLARQGASRLSYSDFKSFFRNYNMREELRKLLSYPRLLIRLSSFMYLVSPRAFHFIVGRYGRKSIHF